MKKIDLMYSISMMIVSLSGLILCILNIIGVDVPFVVAIIIAIIDVIALPIAIYGAVKKIKISKNK